MLGFTALSETPFSQATTSVVALGYLSTSIANTQSGTLTYEALAHVISPSATAAGIANAFGEVDAQATTAILAIIATLDLNTLAEVYGEANPTPSAVVVGTLVVQDFADVEAKANFTFPTTISIFTNSGIDFDAKASITPSNVLSTFTVNDFTDVHAKAHTFISSSFIQGYVDLSDPNAVRFPYQEYADDYYRGRTLYIVGYDKNNTVYVGEENRTSFVAGQNQNNTVYVVPENRTVVIEKQQGSNTVHIAA